MNPFDSENNKIHTMIIHALPSCLWGTSLDYHELCCDKNPKSFGMSGKCDKLRRSNKKKKRVKK